MNKLYILLGLLVVLATVFAHPGHDHHHHHSDEESEAEEGGPTSVINLSESNFQQIITEHDVSLVMFYAPWCGHCKNLKPEYAAASVALASNEKIAMAKVDCTVQESLCSLNKIKGYPTLILYKNGVPEPWEGDRTSKGIQESLLSELLPPVTTIETEEELKKFNELNKISVVGFFDNDHDDRYTLFKSVVGKLKKFTKFGAVVGKDFSSKYATKSSTVVVFKSEETAEEKQEFQGSMESAEELTKFVRVSILPLIGEINSATYKKYDGAGLPLVYVFISRKVEGQQESVVGAVQPVAKKFQGKVIFCWVDHSKYPQQAKYMGLTGDNIPAAALEVADKGEKYLKDETEVFDTANVEKWIQAFVDGTLSPFVKSEPIPADNNGPVKIVVGKTYEEIVLAADKDVLVEFYAPWCGHCKNLEPIYKNLGEHFANTPSIVIAKIDATTNDVPSKLGITGFPTILYFRANSKDTPLSFEGHRDFDSLVEFVKSKASIDSTKGIESLQENTPVPTTATEESKKSTPSHDEL